MESRQTRGVSGGVRDLNRRSLLTAAGAIAANGLSPFTAAAQAEPKSKTFVLVHGGWHGAWCWSRLAAILAQKQHRAFAVTQTGLGDRCHLLGAATHINVFVEDVVNVIEAEELKEVVLIGHSFGGISITGAAARLSGRIRSLVYLDAGFPEVGESAISPLSPSEQERRRKTVIKLNGVDVLMPPTTLPAYWGVTGADADWVVRRLTPHPFATYVTPLQYDKDNWEKIPRTYIQCTAPRHPALGESQARLRANPKWKWIEFPSGHDPMISNPVELARVLESI